MNKRNAVMLCLMGGLMFSSADNCLAVEKSHFVSAAVESEARLQRDRDRDENRHPQAILSFFEIALGQQVLDLFSGGGYYSELLSRVVGEKGGVLAHNNQAYLPFAKEDLAQRRYAERLPNVEVLISEADALDFTANRFDRIFFILGFHDTYYAEPGWPSIDREHLLAQLYTSLKPGGIVAIIDHDAPKGSGVETAHRLHRLAENHVIEAMQKAGFKLEDSLALLHNPEDEMTLSAFDERIRGKTSRYVLKFVKPD